MGPSWSPLTAPSPFKESTWARTTRWRRDLCWNWVWHNLPRDDITASCGEVNDLIGRLLGEASPAVHLAHRDLARSQQSPEQHRGSFRGRQDGLGLDPSLELFMQTFNCV